MDPAVTGKKYDKIAQWWHDNHINSENGIKQFERALAFCNNSDTALDVGCGVGGRFISRLTQQDFSVTGIDVSAEMINLARRNHPQVNFLIQDICSWETRRTFDFIVAWDSIFHLPLDKQQPVVNRLCQLLTPGGVLIYTFGDATGEHDDQWHNDVFHYSSIGIQGNLDILRQNQVTCKHLELDQWPLNHVYLIGVKS